MIPSSLDALHQPSDGMHEILFSVDPSKILIREVSIMFLMHIYVLVYI